MLEIPEAFVIAAQVKGVLQGKQVQKVIAAHTPHGFAWYYGDPARYAAMLEGKTLRDSLSRAGMVELRFEDVMLVFSDGINLRHHLQGEKRPEKHQLLLEFTDGCALSAAASMYGGLYCTAFEDNKNPYYQGALQKPSPLAASFTREYFMGLFLPELTKLPLKAFLATDQRIPGLGNGVLQDILYNARLHPRAKVAILSDADKETLFVSIKDTLQQMTQQGGRDTEKDLFGASGSYKTRLSKNTVGKPCPQCGQEIRKEAFLGGSIYFCSGCQPGD